MTAGKLTRSLVTAASAIEIGTSPTMHELSVSTVRKQPSKGRAASSRQDWQTPEEFLRAVKKKFRFSEFTVDLAASQANAACDFYLDQASDSLKGNWSRAVGYGWGWLNPPYGRISPWAAAAYRTVHADGFQGGILMLVPAAVGSNWWKFYVHKTAKVHFLNGRITFVGATDPYPKDCALLEYSTDAVPGYDVWSWKK